MAGTRNNFYNKSSAYITLCIAKLYAIQHQYAFVYHKNLGAINKRSYGSCNSHNMSPWNKIPLIQRYLLEVEILIWIDLDGVIQQMNTPLDMMLPVSWNNSACNSFHYLRELGRDINIQNSSNLPGTASEPFLWVTLDINVRYSVNINTAVLAIKRENISFRFLRDVWDVGNDPELFKRFDPEWSDKLPCMSYWGWPWEQGGIWAVLQNPSHIKYLQGTCILPHRTGKAINSVTDQWQDGRISTDRPFIIHHPQARIGYWLVALMIKYMKPLVLVQQHCHPSVVDVYKEVLSEWKQAGRYARISGPSP